MDTETQISLFDNSIHLIRNEENAGISKNLKNPTTLKKPPCSPVKNLKQQAQKTIQNTEKPLLDKCVTNFYKIPLENLQPSPSKRRINSNSDNIPKTHSIPDEKPACNEIKLFGSFSLQLNPEQTKKTKKNIRKICTSCESSKTTEKSFSNKSMILKKVTRNSSQNIRNSTSLRIQNNSFASPGIKANQISSFYTPDTHKTNIRVYTPVLTEKKRKMPEIGLFCKRISLFDKDRGMTFSKDSQESFNSFKDQSTRVEDSTTLGEITPIKNEDIKVEYFPDESFTSPIRTIKILNSPEEGQIITPDPKEIITPDSNDLITPEQKIITVADLSDKKNAASKNKASRKGIIDFSTPDSHFFSLSSSSDQDAGSDVSISEDIQPSFGDISSMHGKSNLVYHLNKEMQTEGNFQEIIGLLNDPSIVNGLKMIGKFSEIFKLINNN